MRTNYKELYYILIKDKFPEKLNDPKVKWKLEHINSFMSILDLNNYLFSNENYVPDVVNSRLRSYTQDEILRILKFQKQFEKSNTEIIKKYGMSRATLITWKNRFKNIL